MKKSEILALAKKQLWGGAASIAEDEEVHICNAILFVMKREVGAYLRGEDLRAWISELLGRDEEGHPHTTLTAWIWTHHPEAFEPPFEHHVLRTQVTRHAWIDWMIGYWEARGE